MVPAGVPDKDIAELDDLIDDLVHMSSDLEKQITPDPRKVTHTFSINMGLFLIVYSLCWRNSNFGTCLAWAKRALGECVFHNTEAIHVGRISAPLKVPGSCHLCTRSPSDEGCRLVEQAHKRFRHPAIVTMHDE